MEECRAARGRSAGSRLKPLLPRPYSHSIVYSVRKLLKTLPSPVSAKFFTVISTAKNYCLKTKAPDMRSGSSSALVGGGTRRNSSQSLLRRCIVDFFARRLQVQKVPTKQIAEYVQSAIGGKGVWVSAREVPSCPLQARAGNQAPPGSGAIAIRVHPSWELPGLLSH